MEKHVVEDSPLLIPAGTELKLSDRDAKIRAHFLTFLDDGIVKAIKQFQLKIGTQLWLDKGLFKQSKKGIAIAQFNKNVDTEPPIDNNVKGKRETTRPKGKFEDSLSRGLSNKTAIRGGQ